MGRAPPEARVLLINVSPTDKRCGTTEFDLLALIVNKVRLQPQPALSFLRPKDLGQRHELPRTTHRHLKTPITRSTQACVRAHIKHQVPTPGNPAAGHKGAPGCAHKGAPQIATGAEQSRVQAERIGPVPVTAAHQFNALETIGLGTTPHGVEREPRDPSTPIR